MLLAIDIGNTLIDFGFFKEKKLESVYKAATKPIRSEDEYRSVLLLALEAVGIKKEDVHDIIISCVVPSLIRTFFDLSVSFFGKRPLVLGPVLTSGVKLNVDNPLEVGSDLVADSAGAKTRYGGGIFIADLGTASKYILLDKDGDFSGLVIAPGFRLSIEALVKGAAALPEVSLLAPKKVIGKNTLDCMNSGITYGTAFEALGFASAFEKEIGYPLQKVLTGGNAKYVASLLEKDFIYDENLLLYGLEAIYSRKRGNKR